MPRRRACRPRRRRRRRAPRSASWCRRRSRCRRCKLAGIAEDAGADGPVRTAIISGGGQLFMVKEGETVTPRYRVAKISADVVELTDVIDNSVRRLALR